MRDHSTTAKELLGIAIREFKAYEDMLNYWLSAYDEVMVEP